MSMTGTSPLSMSGIMESRRRGRISRGGTGPLMGESSLRRLRQSSSDALGDSPTRESMAGRRQPGSAPYNDSQDFTVSMPESSAAFARLLRRLAAEHVREVQEVAEQTRVAQPQPSTHGPRGVARGQDPRNFAGGGRGSTSSTARSKRLVSLDSSGNLGKTGERSNRTSILSIQRSNSGLESGTRKSVIHRVWSGISVLDPVDEQEDTKSLTEAFGILPSSPENEVVFDDRLIHSDPSPIKHGSVPLPGIAETGDAWEMPVHKTFSTDSRSSKADDMMSHCDSEMRQFAGTPSQGFSPGSTRTLDHNGQGYCMEAKKMRVRISSAHGLNFVGMESGAHKSVYCTCEIQGKPGTKFSTRTIYDTCNPMWEHEEDLLISSDEQLCFMLFSGGHGREDYHLGHTVLAAADFFLEDFEGCLLLSDSSTKLYVSVSSLGFDTDSAATSEGESTDAQGAWQRMVKSMILDQVQKFHWPHLNWTAHYTNHLTQSLVKGTHDIKASQDFKEVVRRTHHVSSRVESLALRNITHAIERTGPAGRCRLGCQWLKMLSAGFTIFEPHARARLTWSMMGLFFILFDMVFLPLGAFEMPHSTFIVIVEWLAQLYWTFDIPVNFVTAQYYRSVLESRLRKAARIYLTTWFPFDVLVTLPAWIQVFVGSGFGRNVFRAIRMVKFLRIAKLDRVINETLEMINSQYCLIAISIGKLVSSLTLFLHVSSCIWFYIGDESSGWAHKNGISDKPVVYQYLTALHWTLSQFQGTSDVLPITTTERFFAVIFLVVALFVLACFVSTLTNMMRQFQDLQSEKKFVERAIRKYLAANRISSQLSVRVKKYVEWQRRLQQKRRENDEVIMILPPKLLADVHNEVRVPVLSVHSLFDVFKDKVPRVVRRICHEAATSVTPAPCEIVFVAGDLCLHMYFCVSGNLSYNTRFKTQHKSPLHQSELLTAEEMNIIEENSFTVRIGPGDWLSEASLWTDWEHRGELFGLDDSSLLALSVDSFIEVVKTSVVTLSLAAVYARQFVVALNKFGTNYTDYLDNEELFEGLRELPQEEPSKGFGRRVTQEAFVQHFFGRTQTLL